MIMALHFFLIENNWCNRLPESMQLCNSKPKSQTHVTIYPKGDADTLLLQYHIFLLDSC